jgi:3-phosphoshikimate 1-carboxyvinyltransferase
MSQMRIRPSGPLRGHIRVPGDKSISHRALILGAIADGASRIENYLPAADCRATLGAIRAIGVEVEEVSGTSLVIHGRGLRGLQEPSDLVDCVRSGTTMRLLAGLLAGQPFLSVLGGESQLRRRPMGRIIEPLRLMGATILGRDGGRLPPLAVQGGDLHGIDYTLPVASAQVKSALLLAGLYADSPTTIREPGPARDHTERLLGAMGTRLEPGNREVRELRIWPGESLGALDVEVPGDLSAAAFLVVAAALVSGSEIMVEGVGVNPTRAGLLDSLRAMGAALTVEKRRDVSGEPVADLAVQATELCGVEVDGDTVVRMIDEFPILAVAATQAQGETLVRDASELRVKETDRIATTVAELRRLGAEIEARADGFVVYGPTPLAGTTVHSHGDHRLAMALAVACIVDSFPGFEALLRGIANLPNATGAGP